MGTVLSANFHGAMLAQVILFVVALTKTTIAVCIIITVDAPNMRVFVANATPTITRATAGATTRAATTGDSFRRKSPKLRFSPVQLRPGRFRA